MSNLCSNCVVFTSPSGTLLVILAIAFVAPLVTAVAPKLRVPALVFEIVLGIVVGPDVLDLVELSEPVDLLGEVGLSTLIFMAGYEIDSARLRGKPARLAGLGWLGSVTIGIALAAVLQAAGVVRSELFVGLALTTTALGALVPIVRDAGLMSSPFGTHVLATGSIGEFGPIIAVALVLSGASPTDAAWSLAIFAGVSAVAFLVTARLRSVQVEGALQRSLHTSGQLFVRLAVLLIAVMTFIAGRLGLDILLGAFTAGVLFRLLVTRSASASDATLVETKLEAVAFGYAVPIFFVITGIRFDLEALSSASALLKLPLFLVLFLIVRGLPVLAYRAELPDSRQRLGLALLSATALPLVVVITTIGVETGQMRPPTAAALVGAGLCSIIVYPALGIALAKRGAQEAVAETGPSR